MKEKKYKPNEASPQTSTTNSNLYSPSQINPPSPPISEPDPTGLTQLTRRGIWMCSGGVGIGKIQCEWSESRDNSI